MIENTTLLLDPAAALVAQWIVALVFALALAHKLKAPKSFVATLENYRLIPDTFLRPAAALVIVAELAITLGLAAGLGIAAAAAAILLSVYTTAIAINLARGRRDIDCGCSGPAMRQTLEPWLVFRNILLIGIALLGALPAGTRSLTLTDALTTLASLSCFLLLYSAANRLSATASRFVR